MSNGFDSGEMAVLAEVLKEYMTDLRTEILDTDDFEYREDLKKKEELLRGILSKIERARVTALN
jgi:hypothetical protein